MSCTPPSLINFTNVDVTGIYSPQRYTTTTHVTGSTWTVSTLRSDGTIWTKFTAASDTASGCKPTTFTAQFEFSPSLGTNTVAANITVSKASGETQLGAVSGAVLTGSGGTITVPLEWFRTPTGTFIGFVFIQLDGYTGTALYTCNMTLNFSGEYTPLLPGPWRFDDLSIMKSGGYCSYLGNQVWRYEANSYTGSTLYCKIPGLQPAILLLDIEYPPYEQGGSPVTSCPFALSIEAYDSVTRDTYTVYTLNRASAPPGHTTITIPLDWSDIKSTWTITAVKVDCYLYTYSEDPLITFSITEPAPTSNCKWTNLVMTYEDCGV